MTPRRTQTEIEIFHAGTVVKDGRLQTAGGRVLAVAAVRETLAEAVRAANEGVGCITFVGMQYRSDIAFRSVLSTTLHVVDRS
jgi:phosphoribosylamine--glycine ligase/phosphoribosylformylglycinamidine cyclo-ligase